MHYDISPWESVSEAVVSAVRIFEGRGTDTLGSLDETIDPQALDAIFAERSNGEPRYGGRISFIYGHSRITVDNNEYIEVTAEV